MRTPPYLIAVGSGARVGLLALACACGPSSDSTTGASTTDASTADASTAEASTADASTAASPTEGGSTAGGSTAGESTAGEACVAPPQEPVGPAVSITITNMRATPVYIDRTIGCAPVRGYRIVPAGSDKPLPIDADCQFRCNDVLAGAECECDLGCPADSIQRINPGESVLSSWSGGQIAAAQLADGCGPDSCGGSCVIDAPAPAGDYTLVVPASSTVGDCQDVCDCPPDEMPCVFTANRGPEDLTIEFAWNYPAMTELAVVFE